MNFILTSFLHTYDISDLDNKKTISLTDKNKMLSNIKRFCKKFEKFVFVANNPFDFEDNQQKLENIFESFSMSNLCFSQKYLLDERNKKDAKIILKDADIIILGGGKCLCQNLFLKEIKFKEIIKDFDGLIIGISAGAMNLSSVVANYAEEPIDLKEPRWFSGLGFFDEIIIPHFDGKNLVYELPFYEIKVVKDYILPMSKKGEFIAIDNNSYLVIDEHKKLSIFGSAYKIKNGKVSKIKR